MKGKIPQSINLCEQLCTLQSIYMHILIYLYIVLHTYVYQNQHYLNQWKNKTKKNNNKLQSQMIIVKTIRLNDDNLTSITDRGLDIKTRK